MDNLFSGGDYEVEQYYDGGAHVLPAWVSLSNATMLAVLIVCILYIIQVAVSWGWWVKKSRFTDETEGLANSPQWLGGSAMGVRDDYGTPPDSADLVQKQMAAASGANVTGVFGKFTEPLIESGRYPDSVNYGSNEPWAKHSNSTAAVSAVAAAAPARPAVVGAPAAPAVSKFTDHLSQKSDLCRFDPSNPLCR
jgi:hypothetical protein